MGVFRPHVTEVLRVPVTVNWVNTAARRGVARVKQPIEMVGAIGFELEAFSGRERVRVPGTPLRDGVEEREPAAEILSEAKDRQ